MKFKILLILVLAMFKCRASHGLMTMMMILTNSMTRLQ